MSSSMVSTRTTPVCLNMSSYTASDPAMEPVWELAAAPPRALRPTFSTTMGFLRLTRFRVSASSRPLPQPSI